MLALLLSTALAGTPARDVVFADLGLHVVGVGWQRTLTPHVAFQTSVDLWVPWTWTGRYFGGDRPTSDVAGLVIRVRPVFHPLGDAPSGLWVSPFVQAGPARATRGDGAAFGVGWAAGASVGYAGIVAKHLFLSAGAGVQVHGAQVPLGSTASPSFVSAWPTIDLGVGYAW